MNPALPRGPALLAAVWKMSFSTARLRRNQTRAMIWKISAPSCSASSTASPAASGLSPPSPVRTSFSIKMRLAMTNVIDACAARGCDR